VEIHQGLQIEKAAATIIATHMYSRKNFLTDRYK
jgi:hypothetical protein